MPTEHTHRPFSTLKQVPLVPSNWGQNDSFKKSPLVFSGGFKLEDYHVLRGAEDVRISNKTFVVVTPSMDVDDVYEKKTSVSTFLLNLKRFGLVTSSGQTIRHMSDRVYVGGKGTSLFLVPDPYTSTQMYLKPSTESFLEVSSEYPYNINVTYGPIAPAELHRRLFEVEFSNSTLVIRVRTNEGYRYLAPNIDGRLRATGLILVDTKLNDYHFKPIFDEKNVHELGADFTTKEIKYFNNFESSEQSRSAELRTVREKNTNLMLTAPIEPALNNQKAEADVAILKSNFSPAGSYTNS